MYQKCTAFLCIFNLHGLRFIDAEHRGIKPMKKSMKESLKKSVYARGYARLKIKVSNTENVVLLGAASLNKNSCK
ncbi:hypothetical protein J4457_04865 [Candidatus Woesearchaeota archaeon]|nr:hypothetical protein [Candidatus Woesearchaeota archaeon]